MIEILRRYKFPLALILLAVMVEMAFNAMVPLSLSFLIDDGLTPHNYQAILLIVSALAAGAVAVSVVGLCRDRLYSVTQSSVLADLRQLIFEHLQRLSIGSHTRMEPGAVLSRFSSDLTSLENAMGMAIPWGLLPGFEAVISAALLLMLDWRLACVALILWPWTIFVPRLTGPRAATASLEYKARQSQLLGGLGENLSAQPLVKAFNLQSLAIAQFREASQALAQSSTRASFYNSIMARSTSSGILLIQVCVLGLSAYMAFYGKISLGTLVSFQGLLLMMSNSLLYVMEYAPNLVQAGAALSRVQELLREEPGVTDLPDAVALAPFKSAIAFDRVDFSYAGPQLSLAGVDLRIPRGHNVAFVGSSGSGKSTALAMLLRFYDPIRGAISIDGRPLPSVLQTSLRAQMGVVSQESFLLNTSVSENIRMGKRDAGEAEIVRAAKAAEIHDAIMAMPQQYDTVVGERGGKLSGGQRQRIAIARAIIKDPPILLLDEATSALDPATEALINQTLRRLGRGRTVVAVTHRLASVTDADRIFVFAAGRVVESGSHPELLRIDGAYAQLWAKQSGFSTHSDGLHVSVTPERLSAIPILSELRPEQLEATARLCLQSSWRPGEDVFRQGESGNLFYIIVRGRFRVIRDEQVVATLEDGDCFGEIALVMDRPRNATLRAVTPSVVLTLDRQNFQRLLRDSPRMQERISVLVRERMEA